MWDSVGLFGKMSDGGELLYEGVAPERALSHPFLWVIAPPGSLFLRFKRKKRLRNERSAVPARL
jgi:hypothetical protein